MAGQPDEVCEADSTLVQGTLKSRALVGVKRRAFVEDETSGVIAVLSFIRRKRLGEQCVCIVR